MKFIFKQDNRKNWHNITDSLLRALNEGLPKDFEVEIKLLNFKRSGSQLKAYWVLVESVRQWMNDKGNTFTKENVSDWIKIRAGHAEKIGFYEVPKSIANKSECSKEQMEAIINTILVFGSENGVLGCEIEDRELKSLLEYYG